MLIYLFIWLFIYLLIYLLLLFLVLLLLLLLLLLSLLLLVLFVFNIYVLAVIITVISSVRRVITNDQRLTEYSRPYISNTFLSILAVPNNGLFCISPTLHVMPIFPIHLSNSAKTLPRVPITTGTISAILNFHNLLISFFQILVLFHFFFFFPLFLHQLVLQQQ